MLIGSDCSVVTEPVAELAPHWNLVQVCMAICFVIDEAISSLSTDS